MRITINNIEYLPMADILLSREEEIKLPVEDAAGIDRNTISCITEK